MEVEKIVLSIGLLLSLCYAIYLVAKRNKSQVQKSKSIAPEYINMLQFREQHKEIRKVGVILTQCERWVNTNEHEMASIYYEIIANECKRLSEEHKRSI